jgi:hypothetical protein
VRGDESDQIKIELKFGVVEETALPGKKERGVPRL